MPRLCGAQINYKMKRSWRHRLADLVEVAPLLGLASGTAIALAFGKLLLAAVLCGFAVGAWLRVKRGRVAGQRGEAMRRTS